MTDDDSPTSCDGLGALTLIGAVASIFALHYFQLFGLAFQCGH